MLHLSRPGNQTRVILLAVGLGAFFIVGIRSLQASLLDEFSLQLSEDSPDMFLLDIQKTQADDVRAFMADPANGAGPSQLLPVLRARVVGIDGRRIQARQRRGRTGARNRTRVHDHLSRSPRSERADPRGHILERPVGGSRRCRSSRRSASDSGLEVGDTMRFDILGRIVSARVTSIRNVEWRDSRNGGFVFVFRPGALDDAPQTFVSPLKGPADPAAAAGSSTISSRGFRTCP